MALQKDKPSDLFEKGKSWWESKTIWASLVSIAFIVSDLLGFDLGNITGSGGAVEDTVETANTIWNELAAIVSMAIAWWSRIKAVKKII